MRAPFQILAIPYKLIDKKLYYCVLHRSDCDQWQFVAGGGENDEIPIQAAKREIFEECGIYTTEIIELKSMCYIPSDIFPKRYLYNWPTDMYVIPEYSFGFECNDDIILSSEHIDFSWLTYNQAQRTLKWDSNKTALYELNCMLTNQ